MMIIIIDDNCTCDGHYSGYDGLSLMVIMIMMLDSDGFTPQNMPESIFHLCRNIYIHVPITLIKLFCSIKIRIRVSMKNIDHEPEHLYNPWKAVAIRIAGLQ